MISQVYVVHGLTPLNPGQAQRPSPSTQRPFVSPGSPDYLYAIYQFWGLWRLLTLDSGKYYWLLVYRTENATLESNGRYSKGRAEKGLSFHETSGHAILPSNQCIYQPRCTANLESSISNNPSPFPRQQLNWPLHNASFPISFTMRLPRGPTVLLKWDPKIIIMNDKR